MGKFFQKVEEAELEPNQEICLDSLPKKELKDLSLWLYSGSNINYEFGLKYGRRSLKRTEQIKSDSLIPIITTFFSNKEFDPRFNLSIYLKNLSNEKAKFNISLCCILN